MLRLAALILALALLGCSSMRRGEVGPQPKVRGPIGARVQHPLAWTLLSPRPRRARTQPQGTFGASIASAYTSIFRDDATTTANVVIDAELWHTAGRLRYGVAPRAELEVEIPVLFASAGFLDDFVDVWHDLFQFYDGGRDDRPADEYEATVVDGGNELYSLRESAPTLGDVPLAWTQSLWSDDRHALAARAMVELPTGSQARGTSNGAIDWGVGLLAERSTERWSFFAGVDWTSSGDADAFADGDAEIRDQLHAQLGAEHRWNERMSWLAELAWTSPMTRDVPLKVINREMLDLGFGAAWDVARDSRLSLSFHEDLVSQSGPDFGVLLSWSWRW